MKNKKLYNLLFEFEERINSPETSMNMTDTKLKARKALDSIDDQVDALILRYEASSIREEEENPAAETDAGGDTGGDTNDEEAPSPEGSEKMTVKKPAEEDMPVPDLDIDAFAARTVRLIKNYKSLLRIEEAIGNRIKHFLDENYGDKFVQRYLEILVNQYGLEFTEFEDERKIEDDDFAVGAFAGGTGGLGGGA